MKRYFTCPRCGYRTKAAWKLHKHDLPCALSRLGGSARDISRIMKQFGMSLREAIELHARRNA